MMATEQYGFLPEQIGLMTLKELKPYDIAYQKKLKNQTELIDYSSWIQGAYILHALNSSNIGNSEWYIGKHGTKSKYPEKPFYKEETEENIGEVNEIKAVLEMKRACAKWGRQGLPEAPK